MVLLRDKSNFELNFELNNNIVESEIALTPIIITSQAR